MLPLSVLVGVVIVVGLSIMGALTRKRLIIVLAALAGMLLLSCIGLMILVNSPLWPM